MYKSYLKVLPSSTGFGVFTSVDIPPNSPLCEVKGKLLPRSNLEGYANHPALVQVGQDHFYGPSGEVDDYFNHSCNPNCTLHIVGFRAIYYSLYQIPKNSELTFDYSTTSTDLKDEWLMNCQCGFVNCRKEISGFSYLPDQIKKEYKEKNIFPYYIEKSL